MDVEQYEQVSRPLDSDLLRRAKQIVSRYRMFVQWHEDERLFFAGAAEHGSPCGHGSTRETALKMATEGTIAVVATELEDGVEPAAPLGEHSDDQRHVDVALSADEERSLVDAAKREGFADLSTYLRSTALAKAG